MEHLFTTLGLGLAMFISTNIDDIFILLALFADSSFRPSQVVAGQFTGITALFLLSAAGSVLAFALAPAYVGLLGLAPLCMGLWRLRSLLRPQDDEDDEKVAPASSGLARVLSVALVTIANGGDNLGVYVPVFSTQPRTALALFALVFLVMTGVWCLVGHSLVNHPKLGAPLRRYAKPLMPFVLIALGGFILFDSKAYAIFF